MSDFTPAEKHACAKREVAQRRRVYPRLVESGRMSQEKVDKEIACMEAIAADYARQDEAEKAKERLL